MTTDEDESTGPSTDQTVDRGALLDPALLDRMTDAFFAVDSEWRFTYLNDRGREVITDAAVGGAEGDLIGQDMWEVIPDAVDGEFYERYHEAMEAQKPVEFTSYYGPLATWFDVRAYPSASGLSVFFQDVTEEHQRIEQLQAREEALRTITETMADSDRTFEQQVDGLLAVGQEVLGTEFGTLSRIRDETYVFEVVRGLDGVVEVGDELDLSTTNCERVVISEESLALNDIGEQDTELASRAGNVEMGVNCYLGAPVTVNGSVYGTFCFYDLVAREDPFEDWQVALVELMAEWISSALERQVIEEDLRRQNDRLEEFAAIVSHDLRNPLAVAKGQTELAVADRGDDDRLEKAMRAHDRMERIISDMLTMARSGTVVEDPEAVDLSTAALQAWGTADTAQATVDADDAPTVMADESRLAQLLENLFRNAVEHGGESVTVTVEATPDGFAVSDDGPGIPEDDREDVFDHGFSTRDDGTGFGLSIVREIAEAHGWTVSVGEAATGGARFEFGDVDLA
ncbi:sensor histidine kinase [Halobaculum limi]|uniref:sensor histidine kinase n=1 Tax=Halobaculum limi TaxID=3031916 RepID=UPI00240557D3|nr:ATP-binding protein [Halobaculum sp. YSMS11]